MSLVLRPFVCHVVVTKDGDDATLPGLEAPEHAGVADVASVDREVAGSDEIGHAGVEVAMGIGQDGDADHRFSRGAP
jgi:hypothetical protein